jgi:TonB-dependent receptor
LLLPRRAGIATRRSRINNIPITSLSHGFDKNTAKAAVRRNGRTMTTETTRRSGSVTLLAAAVFCGLFAAEGWAGTITGRVTDSSGVRSLNGAEIRITELGRTTVAGADGGYRFAGVAPGRYTLSFTYVGAEAVEQVVEVVGDATVRADVGLGAGADESILVVGQRANLSSSLSRQRASDTIENVLTRDAVGQFPDQNVAEALRRAAGVNILNDQGEGRFVSVRGLDPNLNAASINGARVPAPESDVRSVALDVLPVELIESIQIKKSLTPDMDADTIGASIEINTTSALDREEPFFALSLESSYNDLSEENSPKGSVDFSTKLGERFGIAGGISYYNRAFSTDNVEMDGWGETDAGIVFADTAEYRDYDVERQRLGGSLSLDFRAGDETTLFARMLRSEFEDQEYRGRLTFEMDEEPAGGGGGFARFLSDDGEIAVIRDIKDRFEAQTISSFVLGGETFRGPWTFNYQASRAEAEEKENGSLDPTAFERTFEQPGELNVLFDYRNLELPLYTAFGPAFFDPAEFEFDQIERTTLSLAQDEETTLQFDIVRELALERGAFEIQFGGKSRAREKSFDLQVDVFDGFDGDYTVADVLGRQTYGLAAIDPLPNGPAVRGLFDANFASFELDDVDTDFESNAADYGVDEDIQAAYVLGRYDNGAFRIIGGARFEQTDNAIFGNTVELVEEGGTRNGVVLDEDTIFVTPVRFDRDYDHWLPSVNLRYEISDELLLRSGLYRSVVRPNMGHLAPRFLIEENDAGGREGEFGNPDLEPYEASNFDLSAEWYFAENAALQAGIFYKTIDNFIVVAEFEDVKFQGIFANEAAIPINGDEATVAGLELGYQHALTSLPAPFDGVLLGFNYTYTDAEGTAQGRDIPLPAAAENTANAVLGYEKGRFSLRLAMTYRDEYLDELGGDPEEDRYVKDHLQYDLSAKFRINERVQLYAELINLGDEPYLAFQRGPVSDRLLQYEEYSWTGKFGVKASF